LNDNRQQHGEQIAPGRSICTIPDLWIAAANRERDRVALNVNGVSVTYESLVNRAYTQARSWYGLGIRGGDHVGVLMSNSVELVESVFAIMLLGAVPVPINTRYRSEELAFLISDAGLAAVVTHDRVDDHVNFDALLNDAIPALHTARSSTEMELPGLATLRHVVMHGSKPAEGAVGWSEFLALGNVIDVDIIERARCAVDVQDLAMIIYTSGTTSRPKGAMLSHRSIVGCWMGVARHWAMEPEDRFWDPCPMFHIASLGPLVFTLGTGATFLSDTYFDAGRALEMIAKHRATMLYPTFPPIMKAMLEHPNLPQTDLSSVKLMLNVGDPAYLEEVQRAFPMIAQVTDYGATEAGGIASVHSPNDAVENRTGDCGVPLGEYSFRVVDPDTAAICSEGERGEILIRSPYMFSGYLNAPEATAAVLDIDGWYHTGDCGRINQRGAIEYFGRLKDMLKVGGENVAAAEIEFFLDSHPAIRMSQVIGIPDERLGEVVCAFIEREPLSDLVEEDVLEFCRGRIATFKVPRQVHFIDAWPMSATKVRKHKLRELLDPDDAS